MKISITKTVFELVKGDITDLSVDSIVNAANNVLQLGGGVVMAIRRKGGPNIQNACNKIVLEKGKAPTGNAAITTGGNLKAKFVIRTVGPVYGEEKKMRNSETQLSIV